MEIGYNQQACVCGAPGSASEKVMGEDSLAWRQGGGVWLVDREEGWRWRNIGDPAGDTFACSSELSLVHYILMRHVFLTGC